MYVKKNQPIELNSIEMQEREDQRMAPREKLLWYAMFFVLTVVHPGSFLFWDGDLTYSIKNSAIKLQKVKHSIRTSIALRCWRRQWHPTPVLLPGKSHGRRSLVGCSPWGLEESDMTEWLHFHFSLLCIGEGNGNPLQCSCLENPRDGGAQSRKRLKWLSSSSSP